MKRNATNDNEEELTSTHKKLKFGVDTILGNVNNHLDNHWDDELRHKGKIFEFSFKKKNGILIVHVHIESPISSIYSNEQSLAQPYEPPSNNHPQTNLYLQMPAGTNYPPHGLWRPNLRPYMGKNKILSDFRCLILSKSMMTFSSFGSFCFDLFTLGLFLLSLYFK